MVDADNGLAQAMPTPRVVRHDPAPVEYVAFYRAHHRTLLTIAMVTGATKPEADDAVAATMKEVLLRWPELTNPLAWARRAVINNFVKDRTRGLDRVRRQMTACGAGTAAAAGDPALTMLEGIEWVMQVLAPLPVGEREVMALTVDGYTPTEIAERLGRSPAAVRHSLCDARRRLRKALQDYDDAQPASRPAHPSRKEAR